MNVAGLSNLQRHFAFVAVMLLGAALVAWWCVAARVVRMDSPFSSPGFGVYFLFALGGELLIGLPYGLGIRAILSHFGAWSLASTFVAAIAPAALLLLFDEPLGGAGRVLGPCVLIAGLAMAIGWRFLGYEARANAHHA